MHLGRCVHRLEARSKSQCASMIDDQASAKEACLAVQYVGRGQLVHNVDAHVSVLQGQL